MDKKFEDLLHYISETDASCASDIFYSLELVKTSILRTKKRIKDEISKANMEDSFESVSGIAEYGKNIKYIEAELEEMIQAVSYNQKDLIFNDDDKVTENTESDESRRNVNYSDYDVDRSQPHSLNESFEHKKVCAIEIYGERIAVDSWQDALVSTCTWLYKKDSAKMKKVMDSERFIGRKISLFQYEPIKKKTKRIPGTNRYVWINNSANSIVTQIRMLVCEFGLDTNNVRLFLRRDLKELHK